MVLGLAALVDLWAWVLLPPLLIVTGWQAWQARRGRRPVRAALRAMALAAGLAAAPFGVYALVQALSEPAAFAFDLRFTLGRLSALSLPAQAANVVGSLATLMTQDGWLALGLVGLFTLRPARLAGLALLFTFVPLLLLGRTTALYSLSYYYLIPLLPLAALGAAAVILALTRALTHALTHSLTHALTLFLALLALGALGQNFSQLRAGFSTAIDPFLLAPADARAAAEYVAARRAPGELVLASPGLAWLLPGETADFEQSLAYTGVDTPHVPGDLPRERYRFSPAPRRARFVIVDNLWRNWGVFNVAGLPALLAEVERWPVVFQAGEIAVYEQPATGE